MPQPAEPGKRPRRDENVTASTEATDELGRGMRVKPKRTLFADADDTAAMDSAAGAGAKAPAKPRSKAAKTAMRQDAKAGSKKAMRQDAPISPALPTAPALAPSAEEELSQAVLTSSHLALPLPGGGLMTAVEAEAILSVPVAVDEFAAEQPSMTASLSSQGDGAVDNAGGSEVGGDGVGGDAGAVNEEGLEGEGPMETVEDGGDSESPPDDDEDEPPTPQRAQETEVEELKEAFIQGVIDDGDDTTLDPEQVPQIMITSYGKHPSLPPPSPHAPHMCAGGQGAEERGGGAQGGQGVHEKRALRPAEAVPDG